jgi:phage tail sheath protein FI
MSTYTYPGVYIQELSSGVHTIAGVATSITAFVGWAPKGSVTDAVLVESWTEYEVAFGGFDSRSYLGYAVYQFFLNGGQQAYIVRLAWDGSLAPAPGTNPSPCATAVAAGVGAASAQIRASFGNTVPPPATLFVGTPVLQNIQVGPGNLPPIPINVPVQFTASGINSDGTTSTLTAGAKWTSSDPTVITMAAGGLGTPAGPGSAVITATDTGGVIHGTMTVVVSAASLTTVSLSPAATVVAIGMTTQLSATGTYSDATSQDLTGLATWTTSDGTTASLDPKILGLVQGVKPSNATPVIITATFGAFSGTSSVSVSDKAVLSIAIKPISPVLQTTGSTTTNFTINATYSDGTIAPLTGVAWSSSNPAVAVIDSTGKADSKAAGSTTISATLSSAPNYNQVDVAAATGDVVTGTLVIQSTGGGTKYLTTKATDPKVSDVVADINASTGTSGLTASLTGGQLVITDTKNRATSAAAQLQADPGPGAFQINGAAPVFANTQAAMPPLAASTTLAVTASTLQSIAVTPASASIANGQSIQMKAVGVYDDGSNKDLTGSATWSSSNAAQATVASGLATGTGQTAGVTITAALGATKGTAQVAVTAPVLLSIAIQPTSASALSNATANFKALGTYSNSPVNSPTDITSSVIWKSLTSAATITPTPGQIKAGAGGGTLTLFAKNPGAWGNSLQVSISVSAPPSPGKFNLLVQQVTADGSIQTVESYVNLSVTTADPQYYRSRIDNGSSYISVSASIPDPAGVPAATAVPLLLTGGDDGAVLEPATDQNFELVLDNQPTGVYLLDRIDIFNLLCIPGETDLPTISIMQKYCVDKRAFYLVDPPDDTNIQALQASGPIGTNTGSITGVNAKNSAYYFPWVLAPDPRAGNRPTLYPPCGFVAGIYAATDANPGVWKAPAGINASLTGVAGLQFVLTDEENGDLNIQAVNCLRQFKTFGDVVWGARTLQGNDQTGSEWKYVPIRRLALLIESSLYRGTQWAVFEPNDETLWQEMRLNVGTFMQGLFANGAFAGTTPQQAYFVKCDAENNPPASVALGVVKVLVGFSPLFPAEFVVLQITQMAGQAS